MIKTVILAGVTVFLLIVTIVGARENRTWAWARFAAFELNIFLIVLNAEFWFADPFSTLQLVSWFFLIVSIGLVALGVYLLKTMGKPDGHFERTTALVTDGIYRFIRHPMYASLFYLTIGACLKRPTLPVIVLGIAAIIAATITAKIEEKDSLVKFGDDYREYMKKTKMFAPYIF